MGTVTIMCPRTGKQVSTGVEMDTRAFRSLSATQHFAFRCWLCGHEHEWSKRWATLVSQYDRELAERYPVRTRVAVGGLFLHCGSSFASTGKNQPIGNYPGIA